MDEDDQTPVGLEQAVIVTFHDYAARSGSPSTGLDLDPLYALEDALIAAVEGALAGEIDGHELRLDGAEGTLYAYGPDAEVLFEAMAPVLRQTPLMAGAQARLRFGPPEPGVRERIVAIA
jgi:hypothetical protein